MHRWKGGPETDHGVRVKRWPETFVSKIIYTAAILSASQEAEVAILLRTTQSWCDVVRTLVFGAGKGGGVGVTGGVWGWGGG